MQTLNRSFYGLWLLCLSFSLQAQEIEPCRVMIKGVVTDADDNPLPFARVQIEELGLGTLTDAQGAYRFTDICPGTYTLKCEHVHCAHQAHQKALDAPSARLDFRLEAQPLELETVQIESLRAKQGGQTVQQVLTGAGLMEMQGQGLAQSLRSIPGLSVMQTGQRVSKPVIQGLHSNRILILNNGIRLEGQQWGADHAPEIDPYLATRLTVVKGAAGVRYGAGALGGVILVQPAVMPDSGRISGQLHLEGQSNGRAGIGSAILQGVWSRRPAWSWRVQGTRKRAGFLRTPDYFLDNTGVSEANFSGTLRYRMERRGWELFVSRFDTEIGIFAPSHLGGQSDVEAAIERLVPLGADTLAFDYQIDRPSQVVRHHLMKWQGHQYLAGGGKLQATYAMQYNRRLEFDAHNPRGVADEDGPLPELDFRIYTHTLDVVWRPKARGGWETEWGLTGMYQNNWLTGRPFIPNFGVLSGGAFGLIKKQMGRWEWEAGARYDYWWMLVKRREGSEIITQTYQFHSPTLTLGGVWRRGSWQVNSHLGSAWRPPHVNELFSDGLHHGAATVERGNPDLNAEQSLKWQNSLEWADGRGISAQLSGFGQYFSNYIFALPAGFERTIRGTFPLLTYTETAAWLGGLDATLRVRTASGIGGGLKGAWLRSWNVTAQEPLIFMPANWLEGEIGYFLPDQPDSYLKLQYRRVATQNQVPFTEAGSGAGDWLPPPAGYSLLNLSAAWTFHVQGYHVQLGSRVDNLLNTRYRDYLNRFRYFADEPGRNLTLYLRFTF